LQVVGEAVQAAAGRGKHCAHISRCSMPVS